MAKHDASGHDMIVVEAGRTHIEALDTYFTVVVTTTSDIDVYVAVPLNGGEVAVTGIGTAGRLAAGEQSIIKCKGCNLPPAIPPPTPSPGSTGVPVPTSAPKPTRTATAPPKPLSIQAIDPQEQQSWEQFNAQLEPIPTP